MVSVSSCARISSDKPPQGERARPRNIDVASCSGVFGAAVVLRNAVLNLVLTISAGFDVYLDVSRLSVSSKCKQPRRSG